jgi:hypothetical protein
MGAPSGPYGPPMWLYRGSMGGPGGSIGALRGTYEAMGSLWELYELPVGPYRGPMRFLFCCMGITT